MQLTLADFKTYLTENGGLGTFSDQLLQFQLDSAILWFENGTGIKPLVGVAAQSKDYRVPLGGAFTLPSPWVSVASVEDADAEAIDYEEIESVHGYIDGLRLANWCGNTVVTVDGTIGGFALADIPADIVKAIFQGAAAGLRQDVNNSSGATEIRQGEVTLKVGGGDVMSQALASATQVMKRYRRGPVGRII